MSDILVTRLWHGREAHVLCRFAIGADVSIIENSYGGHSASLHAGYLLIASLNSRTKTGEKVMRGFLSAVAVVVSLASVAIAGPKEDALQVLEKWSKAFGESNVDEIVNLYAPDALFLGTQSKTVVVKPEGVRKYFENALLSNKPRSATLSSYEASVLSDNAVLVTGLDATAGVRDGKPYSNPGRVTFVIAKQGADWKIVHFHRSAIPN